MCSGVYARAHTNLRDELIPKKLLVLYPRNTGRKVRILLEAFPRL